jgi:hypothetical protein
MGRTMQTGFLRGGTVGLLPLLACARVLSGCGDSPSDAGAFRDHGPAVGKRFGQPVVDRANDER